MIGYIIEGDKINCIPYEVKENVPGNPYIYDTESSAAYALEFRLLAIADDYERRAIKARMRSAELHVYYHGDEAK